MEFNIGSGVHGTGQSPWKLKIGITEVKQEFGGAPPNGLSPYGIAYPEDAWPPTLIQGTGKKLFFKMWDAEPAISF